MPRIKGVEMFRSADQALKWAFQVSNTPIVKMSGINSMRGAEGNGDMTPHDRHAQAALIVGMAERLLDVTAMAWVMANYGAALRGGEYEHPVAGQLVMVMIAQAGTGMHSRRGYDKLVRIYFGQNISMVSARKDLGCGNTKAHELKREVFGCLNLIGSRAIAVLDEGMRLSGLILEEIAA